VAIDLTRAEPSRLVVFVLKLCEFASLREIFSAPFGCGLPRYVICESSGS